MKWDNKFIYYWSQGKRERLTTEIPIIASGGAGKLEHFYDVFTTGKADAALAASIFHFREYEVSEVKDYLDEKGIIVRKGWDRLESISFLKPILLF